MSTYPAAPSLRVGICTSIAIRSLGSARPTDTTTTGRLCRGAVKLARAAGCLPMCTKYSQGSCATSPHGDHPAPRHIFLAEKGGSPSHQPHLRNELLRTFCFSPAETQRRPWGCRRAWHIEAQQWQVSPVSSPYVCLRAHEGPCAIGSAELINAPLDI